MVAGGFETTTDSQVPIPAFESVQGPAAVPATGPSAWSWIGAQPS
jgi:hypothetical protein